MLISGSIADYAWGIVRDCEIDSTCVFITDKTAPTTRLFHLGNYGVNEEVLHQYREHRIYDCDPFTDVTLIEPQAADAPAGFRPADDPVVARCGARTEDYWRFVGNRDIEVVGASSLRLQSRLYLTVGSHRARNGRRRGSVPVGHLSERIDILQHKVAAHLLSSMIGGVSGYQALLGLVDGDRLARADRLPQLSTRETDIARLVCDGRQNKEIAWMTSLSEYTVENYLRRIYQKFGIHNRAALVARMNGTLS